MRLAHNILLLNLNSMLLQCEQVTEPKDIADFIIYCQTSIEEIHTHHELEEKNLFPALEEYSVQKNIMAENLAQHHAFEANLLWVEKYLAKVTPETYDGKQLKTLIEAFATDLVPHLNAEIPTLLNVEKYGAEKLGKIWEEFNSKILPSIKDKVCILLPIDLSELELTVSVASCAPQHSRRHRQILRSRKAQFPTLPMVCAIPRSLLFRKTV